MAYDHAVFNTLTSLEVPRKIALALADSTSPIKVIVPQTGVSALTGSETLAQVITQVNLIRTKLIAAGVLS